MTSAAARAGALAAITAVLQGVCTLGVNGDELERLLQRDGIRKVSARDLPVAVAQRADGATTVAASLAIASAAGATVFATGGIGGVHRDAIFDESGDLGELARTPMVVVCAGAKSILDLPATLERLETLGITVVGYQTDELPGFFTRTTGLRLPARAESATEVAAIYLASRSLGRTQATLVVQAPPADLALDRAVVDLAVDRALGEARENGITGAALTPFLLAAVERVTGGLSLRTNLALLEENAFLAGSIAVELAGA
jgi:pseudouridine-5'-phosphate glycosidase